MTKFKQLQTALELTNANAAKWLGVSTRSIERWRTGSQDAPKAALMLLELVNKGVINVDQL